MNVTTQTVSQQFVKDHREAGSADLTGGKWERGKVEDFYAYLGIELLPWQREFVDRLDDAMARVQVLSFTPGRFDQLIENANQIARAMQPEPRYDEAQTAIDKIANSPARPREGYSLSWSIVDETNPRERALWAKRQRGTGPDTKPAHRNIRYKEKP